MEVAKDNALIQEKEISINQLKIALDKATWDAQYNLDQLSKTQELKTGLIEKDITNKLDHDTVNQKMRNVDDNLARFTAHDNVMNALLQFNVNIKTADIDEKDLVAGAA
jgi:hypothetical protein